MSKIFKIMFIVMSVFLLSNCASKKAHDSSHYGEDGMKNPLQSEFASIAEDRVFFVFDSSDLSSESKAVISKQAKWLLDHKNVAITIEGHCDARGTTDYNIALGERRANAVRKALIQHGVEESRLHVISYGKERLEVEGDTEAAHSKNRRAVSVLN